MKLKSVLIILSLMIFCVSATADSYGQEAKKPQAKESLAKSNNRPSAVKAPSGETFRLTRSLESQSVFDLIIAGDEERVVSRQFSLKELQLIRDIMDEARRFAFSDEAVGKSEPLTTRLSSDEMQGFAIDVIKFEAQSQFYITLAAQGGLITVDAGAVRRDEKKEEGFFFDLLSRIISHIPAHSN